MLPGANDMCCTGAFDLVLPAVLGMDKLKTGMHNAEYGHGKLCVASRGFAAINCDTQSWKGQQRTSCAGLTGLSCQHPLPCTIMHNCFSHKRLGCATKLLTLICRSLPYLMGARTEKQMHVGLGCIGLAHSMHMKSQMKHSECPANML